jgi:hypothetical protein
VLQTSNMTLDILGTSTEGWGGLVDKSLEQQGTWMSPLVDMGKTHVVDIGGGLDTTYISLFID